MPNNPRKVLDDIAGDLYTLHSGHLIKIRIDPKDNKSITFFCEYKRKDSQYEKNNPLSKIQENLHKLCAQFLVKFHDSSDTVKHEQLEFLKSARISVTDGKETLLVDVSNIV